MDRIRLLDYLPLLLIRRDEQCSSDGGVQRFSEYPDATIDE